MKTKYLYLMAMIFLLVACLNINEPVYVEKVGRITTINWGKQYELETKTSTYGLVASEYTLDEYVWKFVKVRAIEDKFLFTNSDGSTTTYRSLQSPKVIYVYDGIPDNWGEPDPPPTKPDDNNTPENIE